MHGVFWSVVTRKNPRLHRALHNGQSVHVRLALELMLVGGLALFAIGALALFMSAPFGWWTSTERRSAVEDPHLAWWWVRQRGRAFRLVVAGAAIAAPAFVALLVIWGPDS